MALQEIEYLPSRVPAESRHDPRGESRTRDRDRERESESEWREKNRGVETPQHNQIKPERIPTHRLRNHIHTDIDTVQQSRLHERPR